MAARRGFVWGTGVGGTQGPANIGYNGQMVPPFPFGVAWNPNDFTMALEYEHSARIRSICAHNGKLYLAALGAAGVANAGLLEYDPITKTVKKITDLGYPITSNYATAIVAGDSGKIMQISQGGIHVFDFTLLAWTRTDSNALQNWAQSSWAGNGKYAFGAGYGSSTSGGAQATLFIFSGNQRISLTAPSNLIGAGVSDLGPNDDGFLVYGGNSGAASATYYFDSNTQTFSTRNNLPAAMNANTGQFIHGNVYAIGSTNNLYKYLGTWSNLGVSTALTDKTTARIDNTMYVITNENNITRIDVQEIFFPLRHVQPGDRVAASRILFLDPDDKSGRVAIDGTTSPANITKPGVLMGTIGKAHDGYVIPA